MRKTTGTGATNLGSVLRQLLEAIRDDRAEFGELVALLVSQAHTEVECLGGVGWGCQ